MRLKRITRLLCAASLVMLIIGGGYCLRAVTASVSSVKTMFSREIIIDAGHGGFDGGAVSENGVEEKGINLAISRKTASLCRLMGYRVTEVRSGDFAVCDDGLDTVRKRKVSDIHNRFALTEKHPDALFLSIHQNFYPKAYCNGTQVFFGPNNPQSETAAQNLQSGITALLQPDNDRTIKCAEKNLYILFHAKSPAVLVECGFISNPAECEKLCREDYRQQMACAIVCSLQKQ